MNQAGYDASGAGLEVRNVFTINSHISVHLSVDHMTIGKELLVSNLLARPAPAPRARARVRARVFDCVRACAMVGHNAQGLLQSAPALGPDSLNPTLDQI